MIDCIGQQLGNYRLTRLLGQGGSADVYLGEHIHLNTQAAIKVLKVHLLGKNMEQFRHEAQTIASVVHPHIVRILDFDIEDGVPFLVMDYAPNGNLRQHHPYSIPLSLATIVPYVGQIASGLQYAHDHKLIHRDIKPENMLLGPNDDVLLSDFGLALIAQSITSQTEREIVGTLAYMAPEQINGKPCLASDQYALGIATYEWLSGERPFDGSLSEIAAQHLATFPAPLHGRIPDISPALEEVVFTALAKDPQERFVNVETFATAFEEASRTVESSLPILIHTSLSQPSQPSLAFTPPSIPVVPSPDRTQSLKQDLQSSPSVEDQSIHHPAKKSAASQDRIITKLALVSDQTLPAHIPGRFRLPLMIFSILLATILIGVGSVVISKLWFERINHSATTKRNLEATLKTHATMAPTPNPTATPTPSPTAAPTPTPTSAPIARVADANSDLYPPFSGQLALDDPLSDNSRGYRWEVHQTRSQSCQFQGGAYHLVESGNGYLPCHTALQTSNFILEVQMQIISGNCGGLSLRDTISKAHAYAFEVCQDGSYRFIRIDGFTASMHILQSGSSKAIHTGLNQSNVIATVANGSKFDLYVNHQKVGSINDSNYSQGQFGVCASGNTEAAYTNAKMWTL
jgi:serine/threonine protein kinase